MPLHLYLFVIAFSICWANSLSLLLIYSFSWANAPSQLLVFLFLGQCPEPMLVSFMSQCSGPNAHCVTLYLFRESESKTQYPFVLRGCDSSILYQRATKAAALLLSSFPAREHIVATCELLSWPLEPSVFHNTFYHPEIHPKKGYTNTVLFSNLFFVTDGP